jgi:hypothetical protein
MAISFSTFYTRAGKAFYTGNAVNTAALTTIPTAATAFTQQLGGSLTLDLEKAREGVRAGVAAYSGGANGATSSIVKTPIQTLLVETIKADNVLASFSVIDAVKELIKQMLAGSSTLDASTPAISVAYGGSNTGTGKLVTSIKRGDGKTQEHIYDEDIEGVFSSASSLSLKGEAAVGKLEYNWPQGSGCNTGISTAASNLLTNGSFETADTYSTSLPSGWLVPVATVGTTLKLTSVEVQTVIMSGTPTAGSYTLSFTNSAGKVQTTKPLAYNASGADVQAALRLLTGLASITVVTTGTTPNFTHTITFTGVGNPGQLTSTDSTTGGSHSIAHATTTAGSAHVMAGARSLEFDADGSQLTQIAQLIAPAATTQYAVNIWAKADVVPAAGVFTVDLVDGIGGSVINDDAGTANSFTFTGAGLTTSFAAKNGVFRVPTVLPPLVYLRIRQSTAISNGTSVFIDDVRMTPMTKLYAGGPFVAVFPGPVDFVSGDTVTLTITNDRAGAIHEWMNRVFDLADNELLIPTDNAGSETIADSLIA